MEYTPQQLAVKRRKLSLEYNENMKKLAGIKKEKALKIIKLMAEHGSVAKAERYFSATEMGQKEIELEYYCKGLIELMRAVKSEIEMKAAEAYGSY